MDTWSVWRYVCFLCLKTVHSTLHSGNFFSETFTTRVHITFGQEWCLFTFWDAESSGFCVWRKNFSCYSLWPDHVRQRIKDTYMYFGGSVALTAVTAASAFRSPALMRFMTRSSFLVSIVRNYCCYSKFETVEWDNIHKNVETFPLSLYSRFGALYK
jgi:hypothetical protein